MNKLVIFWRQKIWLGKWRGPGGEVARVSHNRHKPIYKSTFSVGISFNTLRFKNYTFQFKQIYIYIYSAINF